MSEKADVRRRRHETDSRMSSVAREADVLLTPARSPAEPRTRQGCRILIGSAVHTSIKTELGMVEL